MHIVAFYQHYHTPDCPSTARPYALVQALATRHRVTLIAADAWRQQRITQDFSWTPPGVEAHWLDVPYANAMSARQRFRAYLQYAVQALLQSRRVDRPDLVFGSSTPLTAASAAALAARHWDVPWVFEVQDLWPDFPIEMGAVQPFHLQRLLYMTERWLYRSASCIVTTSPDQTAHVRTQVAHPEKVSTIEYGTDLDLVAALPTEKTHVLRQRLAPNDERIVLYAGSFGRANAIPTLVETAARLTSRDDVCFVFAGDGFHAPLLRRAAKHLPNVTLLPPQPRHRALILFCLANLALVPFIDLPVLATNSPTKLYDSLATGTPVIVTNPGWTRRLVETHDCGWFVPAEHPERLAACIAALMDAPDRLRQAGARAAALARRRFDRATHMARFRSIIESAAPRT